MNRVFTFTRKHAILIQSIVVGVVAYTTGVVINLVTEKPDNTPSFWTLLLGGLIVCVALAALSAVFDSFVRADEERLKREYNTHRSGYVTLNREMSEYIRIIRTLTSQDDAALAQAPLRLMQNACKDLHDTLEAEYGVGVSVSEHIEFEVTFMTLSIDDGAITVAAWANRDARAPKSLALRKTDRHTYVGTETDKLYQDANRSPRFISSTTLQDYKELYPGQKSRIRSSIIYPVVDDEFSLWGTLVVHCDRENFFRAEADKLWRELLEPYTKRLALARVAADRVNALGLPISFSV
jgi:GAF domain-containing protein